MKQKKGSRILAGIMTLALIMGNMSTTFGTTSVEAAGEGTVTKYESVTDGVSTVGYFEVTNDEVSNQQAYCIEHSVTTPGAGSPISSPTESNNENLIKVLYYGYGGPEDKGYSIVQTTLASSVANGNSTTNTTGIAVLAEISELDTPPSNFHVWVVKTNGGGTQDLAYWTEDPEGTFSIDKDSSYGDLTTGNNNYTLTGAVYGVYSNNAATKEVDTLTTEAYGYTETISLEAGTYYVKEISAPEGYALDTTIYTTTIVAGEHTELVVVDNPQLDPVGVLLEKVDADAGEGETSGTASLEGAQFTVKYYDVYSSSDPADSGESAVKTWVFETDEDGVCLYSDNYKVSGGDLYYASNGDASLPLGTITIQETKAPTGYELNEEVFVMKITADGTDEFVSTYNAPTIEEVALRGGLTISKTDSESSSTQGNGTLSGTVFSIINNNDSAVTVDGKSYDKGDVVATITTNASGVATTGEDFLPYGSYIVKETTAPTGYVLNTTTTRTVTISSSNIMPTLTSISDDVIRGGVKIAKYDTENESAQGSASLSGAVFEITNNSTNSVIVDGKTYAKGDVVATITTNTSGIATTESDLLPYGSYTIKEVTAPTGYLNEGVISRSFTITKDGTIVDLTDFDDAIQNDVIRGGLTIAKTDSELGSAQGNGTLSGTIFSIINNNDNDVVVNGITYSKGDVVATITTNTSGIATTSSSLLPYGSYVVKETTAPTGYLLNSTDSKTITISSNNTIVDFTNNGISDEVIRGGVSIAKYDSELEDAQGNATLAGAVFEITNNSTNSVIVDGKTYAKGDVVATITTNTSGIATTESDLLPYGSYTIKEVTPPTGYLNTGVISRSFTITKDGTIVDLTDFDDAIQNDVIRGGVAIAKYDSDIEEVQGNATLEGAVFEIVNNSTNSVIVDGKTYAKGDVVATITTNISGIATTESDLLPYGSYIINEVTAPEGYLNEGVISRSFTITKDGTIVDLTSVNNAIQNDVIRGGVTISKYDSEIEVAQGEGTLEGAVFEIVNSSTHPVYVEGTTYQVGQVVKTITTNEAGVATTASDTLPYGTYTINEVTAPTGYLVEGVTSRTVTITKEGVIVDLTDFDASIQDDVIRGGVTVTKYDLETEKAEAQGGLTFAGTEFEITSLNQNPVLVDGVVYNYGDVVATIVAGEDSVASTEADTLPYGSYSIAETVEPIGYLPTDMVLYFSIRDDGVIIDPEPADDRAVGFYNQIIRGDIELVKIADTTMERMSGITFSITNIATGESHNFVTDDNGYASTESSWNLHTTNTNRGETEFDGVWFGEADPNNDKGALLYGKYLIEELPGENNEEYDLFEPFIINVTRDSYTIDLGTITNDLKEIGISTMAIDDESETQTAVVGEMVTIKDTVSYVNLSTGDTYTIEGFLVNKFTGLPYIVNGSGVYGETTFIADAVNGEVEVFFTFDSNGITDELDVVVYEYLYDGQGNELASHEDIRDTNQTITLVPIEIGTSAADEASGTQVVVAGEIATIIDTVSYENVIPGREYTLTGYLMNKETGEVLVIDEEEVTNTITFTPTEASGSVELPLTFNSNGMTDEVFVVFEYLYSENFLVASHEDLEDEGQTVEMIPIEIGTSAADEASGTQVVVAGEMATVIDTVSYENVIPGREYTLTGYIMNKETGEVLVVDGAEVTNTITFTPDEATGSMELPLTFNSNGMTDEELVVFEYLYREDFLVASHEDLEDEGQTVEMIPIEIGTSAADEASGTQVVVAGEMATVIDTVSYENVIPGREYTLTGYIMNKETGEVLVVDGAEVTNTITFTPDEASGSVELPLTFNSNGMTDEELVVFEYLYREDFLVASHEDFEDEGQTVEMIPIEIGTSARDDVSSSKVAITGEMVTLVDTVSYENVIPGREYTLSGILMDQTTGEAFLVEGEPITSSMSFIPTEANGSVELSFTFNSNGLKETTLVAFETLSRDAFIVATHEDMDDEDQTVELIPIEIATFAHDQATGTQTATTGEMLTIVDTMTYENLIVGREYTVEGILMDKSTGEAFLVDGEAITSTVVFTPEEANAMVEISFTFNSNGLTSETLVVFETLYRGEYEVASHTDIDDMDQTVALVPIKIATQARDEETGTPVASLGEIITIIDTVSYENLVVGREYTVEGILMDKETGEVFLVNGETITSSLVFTAETSSGMVDLSFSFDSYGLEEMQVVAFETLYRGEYEVASHLDIEDEEQTVTFVPIRIQTSATDKATGTQTASTGEMLTIVDTVSYENLVVGKTYTLSGVLMDKSTGETFLVNDEVVKKTISFTPEVANGSVEITFTFNSNEVKEETLVVFESLYRGDRLITSHEDLEDEGQTVELVPIEIATQARDEASGTQVVVTGERATIIDTVSYENLIVGREYTLTGCLMNKETGEIVVVDEAEVTNTITFTPTEASGSVELPLTFNSNGMTEETFVVFEYLYRDSYLVATHEDMDDEDQTIETIPIEIATGARDEASGTQTAITGDVITIIDTVSYENLIPGRAYTLEGILMDQATKEAFLVEGKVVTSTITFTPEEATGSIDLAFTFNSNGIGEETLVVFETLLREDYVVATHADINDEAQTITLIPITISTNIESNKTYNKGDVISITDTVSFDNLTVGETYTITGVLMVKETENVFEVNGEYVTSEVTFEATEVKGEIDVVFEFESDTLSGKYELVAFEYLYNKNNNRVATHEDINDKDQTITITVKEETIEVKTGDVTSVGVWLTVFSSSILLGGFLIYKKKRDAFNITEK